MVHIKDMLEKGITSITVRTVDLDVIVIILGFMTELKKCKQDVDIWIDFGTGQY